VSFVAGFSFIFILFGVSLGVIGYFFRDHEDTILKVAGVLLIIMGLHLSGVITIPFLEQERRLDVGRGAQVGYARSFVVGSAFSAGWSPCIGPTLGAIFALAISSGTVLEAGVLFAVYSLGLSIPFLALGLAYNSVRPLYMKAKRYIGVVNYLSGALLIVIGILIFTDSLINLNETFNFWPFTELAELESDLDN
jgi:cytochrome c-type biogenesis protein